MGWFERAIWNASDLEHRSGGYFEIDSLSSGPGSFRSADCKHANGLDVTHIYPLAICMTTNLRVHAASGPRKGVKSVFSQENDCGGDCKNSWDHLDMKWLSEVLCLTSVVDISYLATLIKRSGIGAVLGLGHQLYWTTEGTGNIPPKGQKKTRITVRIRLQYFTDFVRTEWRMKTLMIMTKTIKSKEIFW